MSLRGRRHDGGRQNELLLITNVPVDDQIGASGISYRGHCVAPIDGIIRLVIGSTNGINIRNLDGTFYTKYNIICNNIVWDGVNFYASQLSPSICVIKLSPTFQILASSTGITSLRQIAFDDTHIYATRSATGAHGILKLLKSDLSIVSSNTGASSSDDDKFNNPCGLICVGSLVYVCDAYNYKIKTFSKELVFDSVKYTGSSYFYGLDTDGENFYVCGTYYLKKFDSSWVQIKSVNQSFGNNPSCVIYHDSYLYVRDCGNSKIKKFQSDDDLTYVSEFCASGDGSSSLFDPVVTGPTGTWRGDDSESHSVASATNISKNGFSGDFFQTAGLHKMVYQATGGLSLITAIDSNTDAIVGEIKNLRKCINCTSYKLYANPALIINLADISSKATIVQIYSCGVGVIPADLSKCAAANDIRLQDNSWTTAQVDQFIQWIYAGRAVFTDAARAMRIGANNGAPTGNYTDPTITPGNGSSNSDWSWNAGLGYHLPLTPNAMVYRLLHAVEAGVSSWSMLATA